jgi:hypothetical protein
MLLMFRNHVVRLPPPEVQGGSADLTETVGSLLQAMLPCVLFVAVICLRLAIQYRQAGVLRLEDDAYYYTLVAQHIATTGISTFDEQTLTNGYHPLWLLLLVAQDVILGSSVAIAITIEVLLTTVGLWFFLRSFRTVSVLFYAAFAAAYSVLIWPMTAKGMEVSLLVFLLGLFTRVSVEHLGGKDRTLALSVLAILCIGARLDAAVFILPTLILVLGSVRRVLWSMTLISIAGALYAGINLWLFGLPFPVSGAVKSLGGLQLNRALLDQMGAYWDGAGAVKSTFSFLNSFVGRPILFFVLVGAATFVSRRGWKSQPFCLGFLAGFALFELKLVAFSSWVVWPWYAFPVVIGLTALSHLIDDVIVTTMIRLSPRWDAVAAGVVALGLVGLEMRKGVTEPMLSFEPINLAGITAFGPIFAGDRVAMGDRAGSFAGHYTGPLTQLEGLVNDRAYFEALRNHADIRPLLCARGVRYFLAYQRDLGAYDKVSVPVLRSEVTNFLGPVLTFKASDEIGRVFDLAKYDNRTIGDEGDNYLYAWRLTECTQAH